MFAQPYRPPDRQYRGFTVVDMRVAGTLEGKLVDRTTIKRTHRAIEGRDRLQTGKHAGGSFNWITTQGQRVNPAPHGGE